MQTLGLSPTTPRTENRLKALFWPTIRNDSDFDYITEQGFWICWIIAAITACFALILGNFWYSLIDVVFYLLAGLGVRQRSVTASIAAFLTYLLSTAVVMKISGRGPGFTGLIILSLLLANIRGIWLSSRWKNLGIEAPTSIRLSESFADKLSDQLPQWLWPKIKWLFFVLAVLELAVLLIALLRPVPLRAF